nr:MAG TPA: hypothetical protein [Bacteriophage sp.]
MHHILSDIVFCANPLIIKVLDKIRSRGDSWRYANRHIPELSLELRCKQCKYGT